MDRVSLGQDGESLAAQFLQQRGYQLLERNFRSGRWGELDLVCTEGDDLVFVEVKTRQGEQYGLPIEAVSFGKRQRLQRAAQYFKLTHPQTPASMRFDVVAIKQQRGMMPTIELYRNIDHG